MAHSKPHGSCIPRDTSWASQAWWFVYERNPQSYMNNNGHFLDDMSEVMKRSRAAGVKNMIITGGSLHESREALGLAKQLSAWWKSTQWYAWHVLPMVLHWRTVCHSRVSSHKDLRVWKFQSRAWRLSCCPWRTHIQKPQRRGPGRCDWRMWSRLAPSLIANNPWLTSFVQTTTAHTSLCQIPRRGFSVRLSLSCSREMVWECIRLTAIVSKKVSSASFLALTCCPHWFR